MKKFLLAALVASAFGTFSLPSTARVVVVQTAPPPPREEAAPAPRRGYTWVAGHWEWRNNKHMWVRGTWIRERRGYHYTQPTWVENGGRWEMKRGGWARGDRDGDGVPNAVDNRPNNPNRR
jgi:hypothetical protein